MSKSHLSLVRPPPHQYMFATAYQPGRRIHLVCHAPPQIEESVIDHTYRYRSGQLKTWCNRTFPIACRGSGKYYSPSMIEPRGRWLETEVYQVTMKTAIHGGTYDKIVGPPSGQRWPIRLWLDVDCPRCLAAEQKFMD